MSIIHSPAGAVHVAAALVAMLVGLVVVWRPKGGRLHRLLGRLYVAAMLLLNATAFLIYHLFGAFGPFHVLALVSLLTVLGGWGLALRRPEGWLRGHYKLMNWSVVGLYAAFVAETGVRFFPMAQFWWVVALGSMAVSALGGWLIRRGERGMV